MCTLRDGFALGTFASYVVEKKTGDVVLRMRADAMHTANITRDARCSLVGLYSSLLNPVDP